MKRQLLAWLKMHLTWQQHPHLLIWTRQGQVLEPYKVRNLTGACIVANVYTEVNNVPIPDCP